MDESTGPFVRIDSRRRPGSWTRASSSLRKQLCWFESHSRHISLCSPSSWTRASSSLQKQLCWFESHYRHISLCTIKQNHTDTPGYSVLAKLCYQLVWCDSDKQKKPHTTPCLDKTTNSFNKWIADLHLHNPQTPPPKCVGGIQMNIQIGTHPRHDST